LPGQLLDIPVSNLIFTAVMLLLIVLFIVVCSTCRLKVDFSAAIDLFSFFLPAAFLLTLDTHRAWNPVRDSTGTFGFVPLTTKKDKANISYLSALNRGETNV
jgi:hypothetical protein